MIRNWLEKRLKLKTSLPENLTTWEVLQYLAQKGTGAYCRGLLRKWQFKSCGTRFFLGRNCRFYFPRFLSLGKEVFIGPNCTVNGLSQKGICLGDRVHIREYTWIQATSQLQDPGVGVSIGDDTYIGPYGYLGAGGGIEIGKDVVIGAYVQLLAENHRFENPNQLIREQGVSRRGIKIRDNVWVGNHVIILDGIEIGTGSIIGAGSVVTHSVPPNTIVAGNPAKVIRTRM